ncbi:MAG: insulinase family protein [Proteobacteria bacterium]|nr:insulinase family protein [Pseudomonadota bacterium]
MIRYNLVMAIVVGLMFTTGCCEPLPLRKTTTPKPLPPAEPVDSDFEVLTPMPAAFPVVFQPSDKSNSASLRFVFVTGSSEDPPEKRGLTELTARLMAKGGTEELSYSALVKKLFPMAASIEVQSGRDQTVFFGRVSRDHVEEYYALIRDVLLSPRLAEADFSRIRKKMKSELTLELRGNNDEELGKAALSWFMYDGYPYGAPTLGTESGLDAITLDDVKAQRERVLCDSRLTIGLGGAVSKEFTEKVREDMKSLPRCSEPKPEVPDSKVPAGHKVLLVDKPSAEATAISIGFPIPVKRGDPDYAALKLVEAYFGQHRTSSGVLMKAIRGRRGFNYGDYAYIEHFDQEGRQRIPKTNISRQKQYFSIWIRPAKDVDKHFVLRLAVHELEKLVVKGISNEDFESTRTFMKRYYRTFIQTEARKLGFALDDHFYGQDTPYFEKLVSDLDSLTAESVNAAIQKYLEKDNLYIAAVTKNAEQFAEAIAADTSSPVTYVSEKPDDLVAEDKIVQELKLGIPRDAISIIGVDEIFK